MTGAPRAQAVHPLVVALIPLPVIVAVLIADGVRIGVVVVAAAIVVALARGPRLALGVLAAAAAGLAVLWLGFVVGLPAPPVPDEPIGWLPLHPGRAEALLALRGALRIVAIMAVMAVTLSFVAWRVLGDTLIVWGWVSYRVVDVVGLGGRFSALIRRDVATARGLARLRARGRSLRAARLLVGLSVPVLMAAFRHADALTVAMEARGFGAHETRTVHAAQPLRVRDLVVLLVAWLSGIALACWLDA